MAMRLQEVHPALVHFPIVLIPTALVADALGRVMGSKPLMETGRRLMPIAAAGAALAGVFGLIAQESVKTDERSDPVLTTHRNLNAALVVTTAAMAAKRARRSRPGLGYLLMGAAGTATMAYSAYLGGHMVYELGVGVSPADGVIEELAPQITADELGEVASISAENLRKSLQHTADYLMRGQVVPTLTGQESGGPRFRNEEPAAPEPAHA
ncbi:MAG TPA: DUF2231 domain-containing protein [Longimicrobiaceae bacterium]|nr:DUF2231 domain-containing protein [Longimicrobiaceae bacterium]